MRIGIDVQCLLNRVRAGLFHYIAALVRELRSRHNTHVQLLADSGWDRRYGPADAKWLSEAIGSPARVVRPPRRFYRLWHRFAAFNQVDVLLHHLHGRLPDTTRGVNVFVVPDLIPLAIDYGDPAYAKACHDYCHRAVRDGDAVIVWSEHTRQDLLSRVGGDPQSVQVCPLAASAEFRPATDPAAVRQAVAAIGLNDVPYVLMVSTVEKRKNHAVLLRAFARMLARDPSLPHRLLLIGVNWIGHEEVQDLVRTLGLGDRVVSPGYVESLPLVYAGADAFVFPSLYEGFGLPPLEAMSCGVPVLAANATSLPEVVGPGGELFDPHDAADLAERLHRVLTDRAHHARLAAAGLEQSRAFSWPRTAERYLEVFQLARKRCNTAELPV